MNVGSLFSGIGGLDLGLQKAGHTHAFFCESDPYRRRVLARHWPGVPCFEDVRDMGRTERSQRGGNGNACGQGSSGAATGLSSVQLLCGGFPCQDLSVAGRRAGLDGSRSGLFFEFARIADAVLPDGGWVLIENVPGLFSSNGGRDFAVLLSTLGELGFHDLAWRVLDSRYLGVPQRRRRVFILARRSRGRRASEVLLEPESGGGDFEAGQEARESPTERVGEGVAGALGATGNGRSYRDNLDGSGAFVAKSLTASERWDAETEDFVVPPEYANPINPADRDGAEADPDGVRTASRAARGMDVGAFLPHRTLQADGSVEQGYAERDVMDAVHQSTGTGSNKSPLVTGGTPADYCAFDPRPDGPRYAACGDAVTVNVSYWIGCRLRDFA